MKEAFIEKRFSNGSRGLIDLANKIIAEYQADGFTLTLRQLYYQFVARDLLANKQTEYKRLGSVISDGRLAGLIDWNAIEDRTRNLRGNQHWESPSEIMRGAAYSFKHEKWRNQPNRVEVWIEKDALVGVIEGPCRDLDIDYFACRGYSSQSEQYNAARRYHWYHEDNQQVTILHLGDHDPSGIDMTRDNQDRLDLMTRHFGLKVNRIALNIDQVEQYDPPPNPAKLTDTRASGYIAKYGGESWELDALEPRVIDRLIRDHVGALRDDNLWQEAVEAEEQEKTRLTAAYDNWDKVESFLDTL